MYLNVPSCRKYQLVIRVEELRLIDNTDLLGKLVGVPTVSVEMSN